VILVSNPCLIELIPPRPRLLAHRLQPLLAYLLTRYPSHPVSLPLDPLPYSVVRPLFSVELPSNGLPVPSLFSLGPLSWFDFWFTIFVFASSQPLP
jgi:hypothetical protein